SPNGRLVHEEYATLHRFGRPQGHDYHRASDRGWGAPARWDGSQWLDGTRAGVEATGPARALAVLLRRLSSSLRRTASSSRRSSSSSQGLTLLKFTGTLSRSQGKGASF